MGFAIPSRRLPNHVSPADAGSVQDRHPCDSSCARRVAPLVDSAGLFHVARLSPVQSCRRAGPVSPFVGVLSTAFGNDLGLDNPAHDLKLSRYHDACLLTIQDRMPVFCRLSVVRSLFLDEPGLGRRQQQF